MYPDILGHTPEGPMAPARMGSAAYRYDQTSLASLPATLGVSCVALLWLEEVRSTCCAGLILRDMATSVELSCGSLLCESVGQQTGHRSRLPGV